MPNGTQAVKSDDSDTANPLDPPHVEPTLAELVVPWFRENGRAFPWRETTNAFHILMAEVLLRQTQAHRVADPYVELVARYPDPESLLRADLVSLREWFGPLGLVSRADRLIEAARVLVEEHAGQVPQDLAELQSLPGIGRYSARAILCLAFGQPFPMIDEGSGRVLRRVLGREIDGPAYSSRSLMADADELLPEGLAREFNLGLIDIAARFCRPHKTLCAECPLARECVRGRAAIRTSSEPSQAASPQLEGSAAGD